MEEKKFTTLVISVTLISDGKLKIRDAMDDQVKISGQRVELGAVESAVLSCGGVKQCAVVVVEGGSGRRQQVAGGVC